MILQEKAAEIEDPVPFIQNRTEVVYEIQFCSIIRQCLIFAKTPTERAELKYALSSPKFKPYETPTPASVPSW